MQSSNQHGSSAKQEEHRSSVLYQPLEERGETISFAESNFNAKTMKEHKGTKPSNFEYWCRLIFAVILLLSVIGIPYLIMKMVNVQQDELGFIKRYNGEVLVCYPGSGMHWLDNVFPTDESKVFRFNDVKGCEKLGKAKFFQVSAGSLGAYKECSAQTPRLTQNGQFLFIDPDIEFVDIVENKEKIVKLGGMNLLNIPSDSFMGVRVGPTILVKEPGLYYYVDRPNRELDPQTSDMHKNTEQFVRIGNHVRVRPPVNYWTIARELVHTTPAEEGSKSQDEAHYEFKAFDCKVEVDDADFSFMCFLPKGAQQEVDNDRESFQLTLDNLKLGIKIEYQFRISDPLKVIQFSDVRHDEVMNKDDAEAMTKEVIAQIHQRVLNLAKGTVLQLVQRNEASKHNEVSKREEDRDISEFPENMDLQGVLADIRHLLIDQGCEKPITAMLEKHGIQIDKFVITEVLFDQNIQAIMQERFAAANSAFITTTKAEALLKQAKVQKRTVTVKAEAQAESSIVVAQSKARCLEIAALAQANSATIMADGKSKAIRVQGAAEADAVTAQISAWKLPEHLLALRHAQLWSSATEMALKDNSKVVLSGGSGSGGQGLSSMVTALMADTLLPKQAVGNGLSVDAERGQAVQSEAFKAQSVVGTSARSLDTSQNAQNSQLVASQEALSV